MSTFLSSVATAAKPRAALTAGAAVADFFRYHGVWAPGVRLFRGVGFRAKALVISGAFAVPLLLLGAAFMDDKAGAIQAGEKAGVGVAYTREALQVLHALQNRRLAALQASLGPGGDGAQAQAALDQALKRLASAQQQHGAELGTTRAHALLLTQLQAAPAAAAAGAVEPLLAAHQPALAAARALLVSATDTSRPRLDPDLGTEELMDGALGALPQLIEATALLRDLSLAAARGAAATPGLARARTVQEVLGSVHEDRWQASVDKAGAVHTGLDKRLQTGAVRQRLRDFQAQAGAASPNASAIESSGAAALQALQATQTQMLDTLDTLLAARVSALQQRRLMVCGIVVASLLVVAYLFMSFRRVLDGGLREVAFHINAMRDGNLTTQPRAWGHDEAASLMGTLGEMQQALRHIVTQVREASNRLVDSSGDIASGAADLSRRTEESAATLVQTAAAMEQIAATARNNADTVSAATRLAGSNADSAEAGRVVIGELTATMQAINESSVRIGDIIGTIEGIAFQTNILALNAAVEAARAGDQGRGFAVVAAEVRALAQRSSTAAREITALIANSVNQVESGVRVTQRAGQSIGAVVDSSRHVRQLLDQVAVGAREQDVGVQQSTRSVQALDGVTQQNASLVGQTAAAADVLKAQAMSLADEVARFKLHG